MLDQIRGLWTLLGVAGNPWKQIEDYEVWPKGPMSLADYFETEAWLQRVELCLEREPRCMKCKGTEDLVPILVYPWRRGKERKQDLRTMCVRCAATFNGSVYRQATPRSREK